MKAPAEVHALLKEKRLQDKRVDQSGNGDGTPQATDIWGDSSSSASSSDSLSSVDSANSTLFSRPSENSATIQQKFSRNLSLEIREWVDICPGRFSVADLDRDLEIKTRADKNTRSKNLELLCKSGVVERFGAMRGHYQLVDRDCPLINFINVEKTTFDIVLPFNLHNLFKIQPKNIIVVAGDSNAGKTAFLLYTLFLTINKNIKEKGSLAINYYSSEMEEAEWNHRLNCTGIELDWWARNFNLFKRSENFHQVIKPTGLNFIDYLEVHDDFFGVGGLIKAIFDKLTTGVAIISLQKNVGSRLGLGGGRSIEKARLYLTIREENGRGNVIKIEKGKNAIGPNKTGCELDFSIFSSYKLQAKGDWMRNIPQQNQPWSRGE